MTNYFLSQTYQDTTQILFFNKMHFKITLVQFMILDVTN